MEKAINKPSDRVRDSSCMTMAALNTPVTHTVFQENKLFRLVSCAAYLTACCGSFIWFLNKNKDFSLIVPALFLSSTSASLRIIVFTSSIVPTLQQTHRNLLSLTKNLQQKNLAKMEIDSRSLPRFFPYCHFFPSDLPLVQSDTDEKKGNASFRVSILEQTQHVYYVLAAAMMLALNYFPNNNQIVLEGALTTHSWNLVDGLTGPAIAIERMFIEMKLTPAPKYHGAIEGNIRELVRTFSIFFNTLMFIKSGYASLFNIEYEDDDYLLFSISMLFGLLNVVLPVETLWVNGSQHSNTEVGSYHDMESFVGDEERGRESDERQTNTEVGSYHDMEFFVGDEERGRESDERQSMREISQIAGDYNTFSKKVECIETDSPQRIFKKTFF